MIKIKLLQPHSLMGQKCFALCKRATMKQKLRIWWLCHETAIKKRKMPGLLCSPNSSIAVLASFCCSNSDFSHCHFGHPPNMMTFVRPGSKFKAITVCLNRVCPPSGRVSWRMWRNWLELCDIIIAHSIDFVISWLIIINIHILTQQLSRYTGRVQFACTTDSSSWTIHLTPPPRVDIQDPCITQSVAIITNSSSNQQLGILLSKIEAASCMGVSLHWPRDSFESLQFGPLLGQVTQYSYMSLWLVSWKTPSHLFISNLALLNLVNLSKSIRKQSLTNWQLFIVKSL